MPKVQRTPSRPVYPTPTGLITSIDAEGRPNIITLGEVFNLSIREPIWVGIALRKATYSHELISAQREYVVNLPTSGMLDQVLQCGSVSGRDGVDKFAEFGLTAVPSEQVRPPLIAECPVNLECKVVDVLVTGDHDVFVGEVVVQHVADDLLNADGAFVLERFDTIVMMPGGFAGVGARLSPTIEWPPKR
ncbi:MAG: flavin reductase family protein [Armatimonadetes bacterium CG_4_9_14_3_um_filter_66_14]|nr:flavin reductase family protein [Armatimonadota bacterium]NCQ27314.1 flavin reductase family protein [Armatimonadota bacterium]PJB72646.1 MAG: flavin reductase family protein [Armatimonadetes bacterium CG_4_9_14_3_um_filter_66_14]